MYDFSLDALLNAKVVFPFNLTESVKINRFTVYVIYSTVKVVDTTERDRALKELEKEKEARRRCEMDAAQIRMQYQLTVSDNNKLRAEIAKLREQNVR